jgi:outer membrane receptor protein involved in Fe transport
MQRQSSKGMLFKSLHLIYAALKLPLLLLLILCSHLGFTQTSEIKIYGSLVEQENDKPVPYATVVLRDTLADKVIQGTTSAATGEFQLTTSSTDIAIVISFMGFETKTIKQFEVIYNEINLGKVVLQQDSEAFDEVIVVGEASKTVFKLDKRVFNVGKDLSTSGASALEVLNNVPSVNVSIEGDISLRGSGGVQILVNGKPSVLADESSNALGTITADMIESIEVITNPSAKYEASGTSGILNIVLKKEEKEGWNGSISANTGIPDNHSIGFSVNRRTEHFNLFAQMGGGHRSIPRWSEARNTNLLNGESVVSDGLAFRNEDFFNVTLGTDYHINDYNVLTLSGSFAYEWEQQPSEFNFEFFDSLGNTLSSWERSEVTSAGNPKFQYELNYNKQFKNNEEHVFLLSGLGRFFGKEVSSQFSHNTLDGTEINSDQRMETDYILATYTFKADYTNPITDEIKLETGAQYVIDDASNDFAVSDLVNGEYQPNAAFTNDFQYRQGVLGLYATTAYENKKWGAKAGLRWEQTDLRTLLVNTNEENIQNFSNFFPSFHTSYTVTERVSFQAGYSRRIQRPSLWSLNPFNNIRNNFSIRVGNPNLLPEFTDSYELTGIYGIGKATFSSSLYHRFTTNVVERVTSIQEAVTFSKPENIGTNSTIGFETNGKYTPTSWLTLSGDFNFNYFNRQGEFQAQNFDFTGTQWTSRLGTKFGLPLDIDLELTGNYNSSFETVQGTVSGFAFLDAGIRKKILKGKLIVNLGVRDLFRSRIDERFTYQPTFEAYNFRQRGRFITFGLSYGFGKGEAMTYSGRRR